MSSPPSRATDHDDSDVEGSQFDTAGQSLKGVEPLPLCPQCGSQNREGGRFCGQCGAPLAGYCPQCGSKNPASVDFCERCGIECGPALTSGGRCQHCGSQNDKGAEICGECGARLLITCPQCGAVTGTPLNFCAHCGFEYSRFVTGKLARSLGEETDQGDESSDTSVVSTAIMIALVVLSIVLIIYIVWQI